MTEPRTYSLAAALAIGAVLAHTTPASAQVINNVQPAAPAAPAAPASSGPPVVVNNAPAAGAPVAAAPVGAAVVATDLRPHGYRMMATGATMFGITYLATMLAGGIASDVCDAQSSLGCRNETWPLFIPVFGPFVQMGYINGTGANTGRALLAIDGVLQATGVGLFIAGAVMASNGPATAGVTVARNVQLTPFASTGGHGLMAVGRF